MASARIVQELDGLHIGDVIELPQFAGELWSVYCLLAATMYRPAIACVRTDRGRIEVSASIDPRTRLTRPSLV